MKADGRLVLPKRIMDPGDIDALIKKLKEFSEVNAEACREFVESLNLLREEYTVEEHIIGGLKDLKKYFYSIFYHLIDFKNGEISKGEMRRILVSNLGLVKETLRYLREYMELESHKDKIDDKLKKQVAEYEATVARIFQV